MTRSIDDVNREYDALVARDKRLATLETLAAAIVTMMDGTEWDADTLEGIAIAMRAAGFTIRDLED